MSNNGKITIIGVVVAVLVFLKLPSGFTQNQAITTSIKEILKSPRLFDKKTVIVRGEVIGEILDNQDTAWINILNDGYNLGIYVKRKGLLKDIQYFGAYGVKGDIVEIKGVFYRDCPLHSGRDIHLLSIKVVKRGYRLKEDIPWIKKQVSFILAIICLTLVAFYFIRLRYAGRH